MSDKTIKVYPSTKLSPTEYVPGVGADGAELPSEEAEALLEAGMVVRSRPREAHVTQQSPLPERAAPEEPLASPDEPAEKPEE